MAIIRRSALSDILGLTSKEKDSFEFNKESWNTLCAAMCGTGSRPKRNISEIRKTKDSDTFCDDPDSITRYPADSGIRKLAERKLSLSELRSKWLDIDHDGVMSAEAEAFHWIYGPNEEKWRSQREFFEFVANHHTIVNPFALIAAAQEVCEAAKLAGEDENTINRYKRNFIFPRLRSIN